MPCYLFTWHSYGSWLPDRPQGYVRRAAEGVLPTDPQQAKLYRQRMSAPVVHFSQPHQQTLLDIVIASAAPLRVRVHAVALDATHLHVLLSWNDARQWKDIRRSLRTSLTRGLTQHHGKRDWFSRGGSRKRVKDQSHFDRLTTHYLPGHHALFWSEDG